MLRSVLTLALLLACASAANLRKMNPKILPVVVPTEDQQPVQTAQQQDTRLELPQTDAQQQIVAPVIIPIDTDQVVDEEVPTLQTQRTQQQRLQQQQQAVQQDNLEQTSQQEPQVLVATPIITVPPKREQYMVMQQQVPQQGNAQKTSQIDTPQKPQISVDVDTPQFDADQVEEVQTQQIQQQQQRLQQQQAVQQANFEQTEQEPQIIVDPPMLTLTRDQVLVKQQQANLQPQIDAPQKPEISVDVDPPQFDADQVEEVKTQQIQQQQRLQQQQAVQQANFEQTEQEPLIAVDPPMLILPRDQVLVTQQQANIQPQIDAVQKPQISVDIESPYQANQIEEVQMQQVQLQHQRFRQMQQQIDDEIEYTNDTAPVIETIPVVFVDEEIGEQVQPEEVDQIAQAISQSEEEDDDDEQLDNIQQVTARSNVVTNINGRIFSNKLLQFFTSLNNRNSVVAVVTN